jgi:serine/threonine protein phosphatase PrpC
VEVTGLSPVFGRPSPASSDPWRLGERTAAVASVRADGADTDWCVLRAASVVGVRHRLAGRSVEDAWAWGGAPGSAALAVADGVGSLPASAPVAAEVVATAVAWITAARSTGDAGEGADDGAALVSAAVEAANRAVAGAVDGASTLVVALVGTDGRVEVARVGDSTAFVLHQGAWAELFVDPDGADMRSPTTAALPSMTVRPESVSVELAPGDVLVLVTDGLGDPLRDGPGTVGPGLADGLGEPPHPLVLAGLVDFSRQGCHDDRTLAAVWRR